METLVNHPVTQLGALGLLVALLIYFVRAEKNEKAELRLQLRECFDEMLSMARKYSDERLGDVRKHSDERLGDILVFRLKYNTEEQIREALAIQRRLDTGQTIETAKSKPAA